MELEVVGPASEEETEVASRVATESFVEADDED